MDAYLYTFKDCTACESMKQLLDARHIIFKEILIEDNPILELGIMALLNKPKLFAPIVLLKNGGAFILDSTGKELIRLSVEHLRFS